MAEPIASQLLAGRGVVITRPTHQAGPLAERIRAAGGTPILFPVLEILDVVDPKRLDALIDRLDEFDLAIFISPNAVNKAMDRITARRALPRQLKIAALGRRSRSELARRGVTGVIAPETEFDSEALLALSDLSNVAGMRIVVFRGEGGRELLGDTLIVRGASLEYAECYRRVRPALDAAPLLRAWTRDELHAVTVTSGEAVRNLFDMVGGPGQIRLRETPLFAPHARIAQTARELGLSIVIETAAGDEGLVAGLEQYFRGSGLTQ
jgi:uroporphyrinogen-III synthase